MVTALSAHAAEIALEAIAEEGIEEFVSIEGFDYLDD